MRQSANQCKSTDLPIYQSADQIQLINRTIGQARYKQN